MITANLPDPIPAFGKLITQIAWRVSYPDGLLYFQLLTNEGENLKDGNWTIPAALIAVWGTDDNIISNGLIASKIWEA